MYIFDITRNARDIIIIGYWCEDNIIDDWKIKVPNRNRLVCLSKDNWNHRFRGMNKDIQIQLILFDETDAMAFKLRWL